MKSSSIRFLWACCWLHWEVLAFSSSAQKSSHIAAKVELTRTLQRITKSSLLYAPQDDERPPADNLLNMVEDISNKQFSPQVVAKMAELEKALVEFLEEQSKEKYKRKWSPRPPMMPPPLRMFGGSEDDAAQEVSLAKAEAALEKLRERLRREEEALRLAEEALQQSMHEEEVLRRAEEALQRSREAAEKRKLAAMQQTEAAAASTEEARRAQEEAEQAWGQRESRTESILTSDRQLPLPNPDETLVSRGTQAPRSTIPLDFLLQSSTTPFVVSDSLGIIPDNSTQVPSGVASLYEWIQHIDGSIHGKVRNSDKFPDGSTIATSAVPPGANSGTVIETASGSQYYLENPVSRAENVLSGTLQPVTFISSEAIVPEGVPSILSWVSLENGKSSNLLPVSKISLALMFAFYN